MIDPRKTASLIIAAAQNGNFSGLVALDTAVLQKEIADAIADAYWRGRRHSEGGGGFDAKHE